MRELCQVYASGFFVAFVVVYAYVGWLCDKYLMNIADHVCVEIYAYMNAVYDWRLFNREFTCASLYATAKRCVQIWSTYYLFMFAADETRIA